jgi:hypothetical protein
MRFRDMNVVRSQSQINTVNLLRDNISDYIKNNISVALVWEQTIPTERRPIVGEISVNYADRGWHVVSVTDPTAVFSIF